eukprot:TRINITY_DN61372_c0_g1_i1.p1 TRINITY_DN61372_c0_g1~~TRINITY_DN61372_c0_g1_i1.p1  ORF type:complete len:379 (+),score=56.65 TRINITY_DN61372_c0_g1_i1:81-1217(+)
MEQSEPLTLKVMRLRQPSSLAPAALGGPVDVPKLLLPMALTQSLVGEPFTGYLHVLNSSPWPVRDVGLKVELQIGNNTFTLHNTAVSPLASLAAGEFVEALVEHTLRDAGTYVLTCNVSYSLGTSGEPASFKRSYRFPALQPFAVSHRVVQMDHELLVECSIENATTGSIYLSSWQLNCVDGLISTPLAENGDDNAGSSLRLLKPRGCHSVIFRVSSSRPKESEDCDASSDRARLQQLERVGSLALGWHVPDGSSGCVEVHQVSVKPFQAPSLELQLLSCPRQVAVEAPFELVLEVVNRTPNVIEPKVVFDERLMGSARVLGALQRPLPSLEPGSRQQLQVQLLVTVPGLHGLQGISVWDSVAQSKSDFGVLCDLLAF